MAESLKRTLETILVVDDTSVVLNFVVTILENANFNVLQADCATSALALAAEYVGEIHLLLSDVQMPGLSGPALCTQLKKSRPAVSVMFMSSFSGGQLLLLNYGWAFLEKPFIAQRLLEMVNAVLHTPDKSQGNHHYHTDTESGAE